MIEKERFRFCTCRQRHHSSWGRGRFHSMSASQGLPAPRSCSLLRRLASQEPSHNQAFATAKSIGEPISLEHFTLLACLSRLQTLRSKWGNLSSRVTFCPMHLNHLLVELCLPNTSLTHLANSAMSPCSVHLPPHGQPAKTSWLTLKHWHSTN